MDIGSTCGWLLGVRDRKVFIPGVKNVDAVDYHLDVYSKLALKFLEECFQQLPRGSVVVMGNDYTYTQFFLGDSQ